MKELIKEALDSVMIKINRSVPTTKRSTKEIDISDVSPINIISFMKENNVPDNAEFNGRDNSYDGWCVGELFLSWNIEVPTADDDKIKYKRTRFKNSSYPAVYKLLMANGYIRVSCYASKFAAFDDTTVYDMYLDGDYDRLIEYYSLTFEKKEK